MGTLPEGLGAQFLSLEGPVPQWRAAHAWVPLPRSEDQWAGFAGTPLPPPRPHRLGPSDATLSGPSEVEVPGTAVWEVSPGRGPGSLAVTAAGGVASQHPREGRAAQ